MESLAEDCGWEPMEFFINNGWAVIEFNQLWIFQKNFWETHFDVATNGTLVMNQFNGN